MTVYQTSYCSLDEAWGTVPQKPKNRQQRLVKKQNRQECLPCVQPDDAVKDIYNGQNVITPVVPVEGPFSSAVATTPATNCYIKRPVYNQDNVVGTDHLTFHPKEESSMSLAGFAEQFDTKLPPMMDAAVEQQHMTSPPVQQQQSEEDDVETFEHEWENKRKGDMPRYTRHRPHQYPVTHVPHFDPSRYYFPYNPCQSIHKKMSTSVMDVSLYILSGVLLILVMDQFVQIGKFVAKSST